MGRMQRFIKFITGIICMSRIHYTEYKGILKLASELRRNQTPSEVILWEVLRKKRLIGFRFIRQHPIFYSEDRNWVDFYIVDFYCSGLRLIIELDGPIHKSRVDYDKERDEKLRNKGFEVLRINNEDLIDINNVIGIITTVINKQRKLISIFR